MDLLFRRYASPFIIVEEMLKCGRFSEFVSEFIKMYNRDIDEQTTWEWYLHHAMLDKTYQEFKELLGIGSNNAEQPKIDFEITLSTSASILNNFEPED